VIASWLEERHLDVTKAPELEAFVELFATWNQRINLSAARERPEIEEHVLDSLAVVPHLHARPRVLDVGSGGGFPVVVAAICLPTAHFTALEPVHKKHAFLRTAARTLDLENFEPLSERLEDHLVRDYDATMSRATFDLDAWLRRGLEHVRVGGVVLGFEARLQSGQLLDRVTRTPYELAGKQRAIVRIEKK
jgi:16S rRNA (guanine527-N7)-methyltransferase